MVYAIVFTAKNKESGEWASRVSGTKSDLGQAKAFYHSECARLIGNADFDDSMVMLIDSYGNRVAYDSYQAPAPEPEPNEGE